MDVHIITGHLGSGKTEVAINFAIQLAGGRGYQTTSSATVALIDIDVVNPYFSAREARKHLEARGIALAAPSLKTTTADLPVLSGDIYQLLHQQYDSLIIDVGGDPAGARILCALAEHLDGKRRYMYCVVNTKRPSTSNCQGILRYIHDISSASRLSMTGLIHNTHILHETSVQDIHAGQQLVEQIAEQIGLPIVFTAAMKELAQQIMGHINNDILAMERCMTPPFRNQ